MFSHKTNIYGPVVLQQLRLSHHNNPDKYIYIIGEKHHIHGQCPPQQEQKVGMLQI